MLGVVLAQGNILAAWLAWSELPFLRRLTVHWAAAAIFCLAWLAGLGLCEARDGTDIVRSTIVLAVPLASIAAQLPLWIVRHLFGWRLVLDGAAGQASAERPLTIRDLLLATLLVASAFALARLAPIVQKDQDFWAVCCVAFVAASGISVIAMLPAAAFLLRVRRLSIGLVSSGLYAVFLLAIPWVVVAIVREYNSGSLPPYFVFVWLSSLMLAFAAALVMTAMVARASGYRLRTSRRAI